ncbi:DNA-binding GntR family transcriptional regulator [Streptomyces sp. 2333.5]|uniref:GntR family transcriptional regulator n=1 Tax=Streptomyces TaxID=1883 RepID=UPI00089A2D7C|nr:MULTISPECIES: GntR family transcriptional regulator [unclassified Streptomyces]PJJ05584.1 DNA-binding GntR family transcriptional regulator [Streptomyces sp. 2333.5]SEE79647.1 DNA-binding transcriptional regulator, GntR family [Streptomyces sp. 2314.4]SEF01233.1 DNA-binding transcriptional regulator, GntR family [Streptomyces sp. 2112.2]
MTSSTGAGQGSETLADQAYRAISDRLVTLRIRPGEPINDEQIAAELGFGRTPVREALKRLETERLIVAYPRRGTFATEVQIADLGHISEVRQQLEPLAASVAAERATESDRTELGKLLAQLEAGGPDGGSELIRLDMAVHRAIYATTYNPYLQDTLIKYDNLATRIWCLFIGRLPGLAGHVREHGPLLRAIIDGDPQKAAALAADHVEGFEAAIREII